MNKFVAFLATIGKAFVRPFFPVKIIGPKKFERKKCLYVANHVSGWDPCLFTMWTKGFTGFVYKADFRKSAFLRWVFDGLECIPVRRGDVDIASSKQIINMLNENKPVALFPEGTRNPNVDCLQKFRTGAALFALKTHSPIRPYYIWDKAKPFYRNYIIVGDEFTLDEFYDKPLDKDTLLAATEVIKQHVEDLRVRLNVILEKKNIKRRKRTKKEIEKINQYNKKQKTLQDRMQQSETKTDVESKDSSDGLQSKVNPEETK